MLSTFEAVYEPRSHTLGFLENLPSWVTQPTKVIVVFPSVEVETEAVASPSGFALSERSLATDWLRPEEDAAWAHLQ